MARNGLNANVDILKCFLIQVLKNFAEYLPDSDLLEFLPIIMIVSTKHDQVCVLQEQQEAPRSIMGRRATSLLNLIDGPLFCHNKLEK